jgi:hypothetical protein
MNSNYDIQAMAKKIEDLKQAVIDLKALSGGIKAVERNAERMLASIRLLELDICDVVDI